MTVADCLRTVGIILAVACCRPASTTWDVKHECVGACDALARMQCIPPERVQLCPTVCVNASATATDWPTACMMAAHDCTEARACQRH